MASERATTGESTSTVERAMSSESTTLRERKETNMDTITTQLPPNGSIVEAMEPLVRLTRDLKQAARTLSDDEARFLVDAYYQQQDDRKRTANQIRALSESEEPHSVIDWFFANNRTLEHDIARALDAYSASKVVGQWARSIVGIGPIISAGLLAHIDVTKAPTVGHIWRFAGLDPTAKWERGQKRPWNAELKTLCWKAGQCFLKVSNHPSDIYGHVYATRKGLEQERNANGLFAEQAASALKAKNYGHDTEAYKAYIVGKLPPAHLDARARRYAVKLFLAHYHEVAYFVEYNALPPKPYVIDHLGHVDWMMAPNPELVSGLGEAQVQARREWRAR